MILHPLTEEFIQFVNSREPGETIKHRAPSDQSPFSTCAVGQFYTHRTGKVLGWDDAFPYELKEALEEDGLDYIFMTLDVMMIGSYGRLQQAIEDELNIG